MQNLPVKDDDRIVALRREVRSIATFLDRYNPTVLDTNFAAVSTASMALTATQLTLADLFEAYGQTAHLLFIKVHLIRLQDYLNVKDESLLNNEQLTELATYIYEDNSTLNLAEFVLVIKQIKKGYFGKIFARIDPVFITDAFKAYQSDQRAGAMQKIANNEISAEVQFTKPYYTWAKRRLLRDFHTHDAMMQHLASYRQYLCSYCREHKVHDCRDTAAAMIAEETTNTYAVATWLLCWSDKVPSASADLQSVLPLKTTPKTKTL